MLFFQQKNVSFGFLSLALNPCHPSSCWASLACPPAPTFSCSKFQNCGHDNISKLNTLDNLIQKQFSLFVFVFIDSFVLSTLQDAGGYAISRQNNLQLHLGCHTCWLSYFTLVCLWCGRTVSLAVGLCTVTWLPNFLGWVDTSFSYPRCCAGALRARELRYECKWR